MDLVVSPTIVGFNAQSGGHPQALSPGQTIEALVLQLIDATTARIAIAGTTVDLPTPVPVEPGAIVRVAIRGHGTDTKFVIVGTSPHHSADAAQKAPVDHAPAASTNAAASAPPAASSASSTPPATGAPAGTTDVSDAPTAAEHAPAAPKPAEPRVAANDPTTALATAIRTAAPRQASLAPLLADAAEVVAAPQLPPPVRQALMRLLSLPRSFEDRVTPADIKQSLKQSGVFFEAHLAEPGAPVASTAASSDLKGALTALRQALNAWADAAQQSGQAPQAMPRPQLAQVLSQALQSLQESRASQLLPSTSANPHAARHAAERVAPPPVSEIKAPPPPYRGAPTTGQGPVAATIDARTPPTTVRDVLLERTEGALARMTLLQSASLADSVSPQQARIETPGPHWNFEVPFVAPQGMAVAHFEVARDGHRTATQDAQAPVWRANFSVDLEPMGAVHAQISVTGQRAAVRLWAERRATAAALRAGASELTQALHQAALEPGEVLVRDGAPPQPVKPAAAGRFLDRAT